MYVGNSNTYLYTVSLATRTRKRIHQGKKASKCNFQSKKSDFTLTDWMYKQNMKI